MSSINIKRQGPFKGAVSVPGDKSISHRAVMISSISKGKTMIANIADNLDCRATIEAFKNMGISIAVNKDKTAMIEGKGLKGLKEPSIELNLGDSGTTMRLLLGILAGQDFEVTLTGDESLSKRPMKRVTYPLRLMGAEIKGPDDANLIPLVIKGSRVKAIEYNSPIASAQVKSAVLLAGLYTDGITTLTEPYKSRDHTERMLKLFGAELDIKGLCIKIKGMGNSELKAQQRLYIPADISSAAFFITLAVLSRGSEITIPSCGINPTRSGILNVLERMGAKVDLVNIKDEYEPYADIIVKSQPLNATKVTGNEVPLLIDEIPLIALCATQAEGETIIEGVQELRVKETDRINSIISNLNNMGANIHHIDNSIIIKGPARLKGAAVKSFGDHRTAMMLVIAANIAEGMTNIDDIACIAKSFPDFLDRLKTLAL